MAVRAKMYLEKIGTTKWGTTADFRVVTRGEDNKEWSAATPTGSMSLGIANPAAAAEFGITEVQEGAEYLITIERVPPALQGQEGMGD